MKHFVEERGGVVRSKQERATLRKIDNLLHSVDPSAFDEDAFDAFDELDSYEINKRHKRKTFK